MYPVKQSTALTIPIFVHDVSGDAVTGLVDAGFTKRISKNGGAFAAMTVTITEMENGWYSVPFSTAHTDTLGVLSITFTHASAKQVNLQLRVHARLPDDLAQPGDAMDLVAGAVDAAAIATGAIDADAIAANAITAAKIAAAALDGKGDWNIGKTGYSLTQAFPANFADLSITVTTGLVDVTQAAADKVWGTATRILTANTNFNDPTAAVIADAVWDELRAGHVIAGSFGEGVASVQGNVTGSVGSVTGAVGSVTAGVTVATNSDKTGYSISGTKTTLDALNDFDPTAALTEGYAVDGATFTMEQALYMIWSCVQEFAIVGTTLSSKKLDSTEAMTWTLDDAADPTSRVRAT